jgi:KDO2-lipid IV(A) lauroyltransferase
MMSRLGILFMRAIAPLPLPLLRAMGLALGWILFYLVAARRHVATRNLELCFPQWTREQRRGVVRRHFIFFAQAWLDRSWVWHGHPDVVRRRLRLTGALEEFAGKAPTVVFAPHFVGLDAGVTALSQQSGREIIGIYTHQSNPVVDAWVREGRERFGNVRPMSRNDGVRELVSAMREGALMYLLPDMNFGPEESIFVPFFGVPAATVPSLSRFARLGRAKVVPLVTRMTASGYDVEVKPAWQGFPTGDVAADTALMNVRLQGYIEAMPAQYYWVHKRFKTRPVGEPGVY